MSEKTENQSGNTISIKRKRIMVYFIEATEKLIREEGIDALSIRKIASEAGYNSATLYNYFEDLEHLVLFASVRYLREYVVGLQETVRPDMNALEIYRAIYLKFSETSFASPEIFYNMFFGRYSRKLNEVLKQYYELFPAELGEHTGFVRSMLLQGNIYSRDLISLDSLVEGGFVREENREAVAQIMVRTHQSFIAEASMAGGKLDIGKHVEAFMKLFDYIMESAR